MIHQDTVEDILFNPNKDFTLSRGRTDRTFRLVVYFYGIPLVCTIWE